MPPVHVRNKTDALSLYTLRGISGDSGMFFRDLDTGKAIQIYAIANMESGESLLKMGMTRVGAAQLEEAKRIAPELGAQIAQMLTNYGVRK